ncbi:MAG TPA: hypothetical protein VLC46_26950 [Thermoanaerobaculia bacterium]|jgi:hypothetical protein|nr:hypothetical protein [Thermoanaerobaculia bacterium]
MRKTLKFRRITAAQFEQYFSLDSPGYYIAKEQLEAGEIHNPQDALEALCLTNQLYELILSEFMVKALTPYGKAVEYLKMEDRDEVGEFVVGVLGRPRAIAVMRSALDELRVRADLPERPKVKSGAYAAPPP